MADDEQLEILKRGVDAWNSWRRQVGDTRIDLRDAKLAAANLYKIDLGEADLNGADLRGATLSGADLRAARLAKSNLGGADLSGAKLEGANLGDAHLSRAKLHMADLVRADLVRVRLLNADLSEADLYGANLGWASLNWANLRGANLRDAFLRGANFGGSDLSGTSFDGANLAEADLGGANLRDATLGRANLTRAILTDTDLGGANLGDADFSAANLRAANLSSTNLSGANFSAADLSGANLRAADLDRTILNETILTNTDLSGCSNLTSIRHRGPSTIDFRTMQRSGELPSAFLRGIGLPDTLIDHLPSLLGQTMQHHSCFISYSSKDEEFARQLHSGLQDKGVRCWFAPEDMKIGVKILDALDQAIRLRDKVLLVLSDASIASAWVEDEVTKAFEEERQRDGVVLFPVRLDDAVFTTDEAWAAKLRARHIGDFSRWKDHDAYQKALERVLRDLRVEAPKTPEA